MKSGNKTINIINEKIKSEKEKFELLKDYCEVVYLPRTQGVSTTKIKEELGLQTPKNKINQIPIPKNERK